MIAPAARRWKHIRRGYSANEAAANLYALAFRQADMDVRNQGVSGLRQYAAAGISQVADGEGRALMAEVLMTIFVCSALAFFAGVAVGVWAIDTGWVCL